MSRSRRILDLLNPSVPPQNDPYFELTDTCDVETHLRKKRKREPSPLPACFEEELVQLEDLIGEIFDDGAKSFVGDIFDDSAKSLVGDIPDISHLSSVTQPKIRTPSAPAPDSLATTRNSPKVLETNEDEVFTQFDYTVTTPMPSPSPTSWGPNDGECKYRNIARRGSIDVSSCLLNFIKFHAERGVKEFSFWSDNCAGQNRNRIVFSLYMFVAKKLGVTVTHRFLEKGHTQNEGDSVHATIERYSKHKTIWVPEEWYCLVRWAKSEGDPYIVKEIRQEDIFDFKALLVNKNWTKNTNNEKVSWNSVKVSAGQNERIEYKYDFDEEPKTIVVLRSGTRNKKRLENDLELNQAYQGPLSISKEKYKDITDLCRGGIIPERYHDFYLNLPHTNASYIFMVPTKNIVVGT